MSDSAAWIHLAQDRNRLRDLVRTTMNFSLPQEAKNILTSWATISFSRRTLPHWITWLVSWWLFRSIYFKSSPSISNKREVLFCFVTSLHIETITLRTEIFGLTVPSVININYALTCKVYWVTLSFVNSDCNRQMCLTSVPLYVDHSLQSKQIYIIPALTL